MRRLLIDSLLAPCAIALAEGDEITDIHFGDHADRAAALDQAFRAHGELAAIDEIIVNAGPGNFTAIRAGIAYARGLALAFAATSRGISSMEIDAHLAPMPAGHVLRDARGGRVYQARFDETGIGEISLLTREDVSPEDAASADMDGFLSITADARARLDAMLALATIGRGQSPAQARYVRPADAAPSRLEIPKLIEG